MNRRDFIVGSLGLAGLAAIGKPTKAILGGSGQKTASSASSYVPNGLFFLGEKIPPPVSGNQIIPIGNLPIADGWTVEVCGICTATERKSIILGTSGNTTPQAFGVGWWVKANSTIINLRYNYSEVSTGQDVGRPTTLAYTVDGNKALVGYALGEAVVARDASSAKFPDVLTHLVGSSDSYFDIYSLRVYSRPLTAEEVAHNYSVDSKRFGV